ncbi:MAG: polysaccharide biosynthesis tyrosine autokinase, partial [Pseudomonadota bacterium]
MKQPSSQISSAMVRLGSDREDEIDLMALFHTLWRGKWIILLITLFAAALGIYQAFERATPMYTAAATVAFESREEQVVDLDSVVGGLGGDQATINTEIEVLKSRGLMEKLVQRLNLIQDPEFNTRLRPLPQFSVSQLIAWMLPTNGDKALPPSDQMILDAAVAHAMSTVSIRNIRQSYVLEISVTTQDAEKSALIANTLAELYIVDQLEVKFDATEKATAWLTERVGVLQQELETSVAAVKDFSAGSQLVSPEQLAALSRQSKDLRDRQEDAQEQIRINTARQEALQGAMNTGDLAEIVSLANDRTLNRLFDRLQSDSAADDKAFLARFDQILDRIETDMRLNQTQITAFDVSIETLNQQIATQSKDLVTLQQLEREAEASRLIYEFFLNRLKETSVQEGIQQADSRVLSRAVVPTGPSAPRKNMIVMMATVLGFLLGCALVLGREFMQNTFRSAEELEQVTGYTVLGQIPALRTRVRGKVLAYLIDKPTSLMAEAVRNLRTSLLLSDVDKAPQIILSTSSLPAEGKTTHSIALVQNLAGLGKRVLLIEGDIRRRVFQEYFQLNADYGLLSVLSGQATLSETAVFDPQLKADVIMGEPSAVNAADLFSSEAFRLFLEQTRKHYEYI